MSQEQVLLRVEGVSKAFPGVQALSDVTLEVAHGEILALVGENGAGKSTLIHILAGAYRPDAGRIFLDGQEVSFHSTHEGERAGVSVVFQELSLVPNLSVAENVFANQQPTRRARPDQPAEDAAGHTRSARHVPSGFQARHPGWPPLDGQPADGRDRQSVGTQRQSAGARRADLLADPAGSGAPFRTPGTTQEAGIGDPLRFSPP